MRNSCNKAVWMLIERKQEGADDEKQTLGVLGLGEEKEKEKTLSRRSGKEKWKQEVRRKEGKKIEENNLTQAMET